MILICKFERDYQEGYLALLKLLASIFEEEPQETLFYKDTFCSALFYQILDWLHIGMYLSYFSRFSRISSPFLPQKVPKEQVHSPIHTNPSWLNFVGFFFAKVFLFKVKQIYATH